MNWRKDEPTRPNAEQTDVAQASIRLTAGGAAGTSPRQTDVARVLASVLLDEWGGPRSPLALSYIRNVIIPNLAHCLVRNADLWQNPTFTDIVAWKFKAQYAFPQAVVDSLTTDLMTAVLRTGCPAQNSNSWEPWRRIMRAHLAGKSLVDVEEEIGYPVAYSNLLLLSLKKLCHYLGQTGASYQDCLLQPELRECGPEQLRFLYSFHRALTTEPLYKEKLILEQVSVELEVPLPISGLVDLLRAVLVREGSEGPEGPSDEAALISVLREGAEVFNQSRESGARVTEREILSSVIRGLIKLDFLAQDRSGGLRLTGRSAAVIAPFVIPELLAQLQAAGLKREEARRILLRLNPGVLLPLLRRVKQEFPAEVSWELFRAVYQESDRQIDLYIIESAAKYEEAVVLLLEALQAEDSLVRAKACQALRCWAILRKQGNEAISPEAEERCLGGREARIPEKPEEMCSSGREAGIPEKPEIVSALVRTLADPVAQVRERAAQALGDIGSPEGLEALSKVAEDMYESPNVRGRAREAWRRILSAVVSTKRRER
ncbi:hypothetical protein CEB3_c05540 [Peptococcaceae bacterium CEB3]|nr:hypothetical protein CEB3_c05540 [Peptococcaceae bacterium CEB3]